MPSSIVMTSDRNFSFNSGFSNLSNEAGHVDTVDSSYSEEITLPQDVVVGAIVVCAILMLIGITGNLLTIIALSICHKLHNATTALVINLSAADLFFCACVMPTRAAMFAGNQTMECGIFLFFFYGNVTASLTTMMAIAVNRYLIVLHPDIYARVFNYNGTALVIAFSWMYSFAVWTVPIVGTWGHFEKQKGSPFCRMVEEEGSPKLFLAFFGFLLPLIIITIAYVAIFLKVWLTKRQFSLTVSGASRRQLRHLQFTRVLLVAYCSFLFFWTPNFFILMIPEARENPVALSIGESLFWISSCTNPVVYVLCSKYYRQAYHSLFKPSLRATVEECSRRPASVPKILQNDLSVENPSR